MLSILVALSLSAPYELSDLKALEKQQGWKELVDHLGDVPPSKRDKEWEGLAERAASAWLDTFDLKEPRTAEAPLDAADQLLKTYPVMKQSKVFMAKRAEVAIKALKMSFSNYRHSTGDDKWLDKIKELAQGDTVTADLPLRLAKEVVLGRLIPVTAFPLFKLSGDRGNKGLCKDADFQKTLLETLEDGSWPEDAKGLATKCWDDIKGPLVASLEKTKSNPFRRNICPFLQSKNALPASQKQNCELAQQ